MKKGNLFSATEATKRGFTLIELLVVIAIIGILASIISPALSTAKMKAVSAKCQSNMRSLATGLRSYADGNDGMIPAPKPDTTLYPDAENWNKGKFFRQICPNINPSNKTEYAPLGVTSYGHIFDTVFECPAARLVGTADKDDPTDGKCYGYGMSQRMCSDWQNSGGENRFVPKSISNAAFPSLCMMLADSAEGVSYRGNGDDPNTAGGYMRSASVRHNGNVNIAFVDGHIEARDPYIWEEVPDYNRDHNAYANVSTFWTGNKAPPSERTYDNPNG